VKEDPVRSTAAIRRIPALLGAAALVTAALAGCTGAPGLGGCDPSYTGGDASSLVTATGKLGTNPTVDFPTPLISSKPQVSVLEAGNGPLIEDGDQVDFTIAIFYGKDGQKISGDSVNSDRAAVGLPHNSLSEAMVCMHVGDRIAVTTSLAAAYGKGVGAQVGLQDTDTLVVVLDLTAAYRGKADGFNQLPQDGMPVVVTAVDGTPAIAVDFVDKPAATRIETVKGGDGATVKKGESVVVQLRAWIWPDAGDDPTEITETNANGTPQTISTWEQHKAYTLELGNQPLIPPGVQRAIIGAKVGSQLLVVIPPGADHYPTVPSTLTGLTTDQTMIWVVDLLGIQK
jgi:peptidylprolyl isomerase